MTWYVSLCVRACLCLLLYMSVYVCVCVCLYMCMSVSVYVYVCFCVCLCLCLSVYVSACACACMCLSVSACVCLCPSLCQYKKIKDNPSPKTLYAVVHHHHCIFVDLINIMLPQFVASDIPHTKLLSLLASPKQSDLMQWLTSY